MGLCTLNNETQIAPNFTAVQMLPVEKLQAVSVFIGGLSASIGEYGTSYPCIKPAFRPTWMLFVAIYSLVWISGLVANAVTVVYLLKTNCKRSRFIVWCLLNISFTNFLLCLLVLPLTVLELLLYYWWLGEFICRMVPIFQTIPVIVNVLSFFALAFDRYFTLFHQNWRIDKAECRPLIVMGLIWVAPVCLSLPLRNYFDYVDLDIFLGPEWSGLGVCVVRYGSDIREMNVVLVVVLFGIPLLVIVYLLVKSGNELQYHCSENIESSQWHPLEQLSLNRIASVLCALFAVGWAPLQLFALINYVIPEGQGTAPVSDYVTISLLLLGFGSAALTPIVLLNKRALLTHCLQGTVCDRRTDDADYYLA